ncbi:unnamed protein product, partial [marine sediment metagenome]
LGTSTGYSAYYVAKALKENEKRGIKGRIDCYDLWEKCGGCKMKIAEENLLEYNDVINLIQRDAFEVYKNYDFVDILHIDLDNDRNILEKIVSKWIGKANYIIFEGGSKERDNYPRVEKHASINEWLKKDKYDYTTLTPFPSLTVIGPI